MSTGMLACSTSVPDPITITKLQLVLCPANPIRAQSKPRTWDFPQTLEQGDDQRTEMLNELDKSWATIELWEDSHQLCQDKLNRGTPE